VQHHNVDKALLIAGRSAPRFGGGEMRAPIRLILCGRATTLPDADLDHFVRQAALDYLVQALRCDPSIFSVESVIGEGSPGLRQVFSRGGVVPLANDTSLGAAYAPCSALERKTLELARVLRSPEFRRAIPAAGDDYKIMGVRLDQRLRFTVALAFVDREVPTLDRYFEMKAEAIRYLEDAADLPGVVDLNMLDDPDAGDESGVYLTVTGLSAEQGDDGQVGRGNRVTGLITPCRSMSLEAAAGKNPVTHVGKLYNVLALEVAKAIYSGIDGALEASVQILSTIGKPVTQPQLLSINTFVADPTDPRLYRNIEEIARSCLNRISEISRRLIAGEIAVF
jgi:S-adenosylmethionine synthetase